ncbi:hypothetical protein [Paraburkholderia sp. WC7.3d]|uniref:Resolvase/invertase-type recombinase catalytic domain-containing protein n=1 Tax=Paraburkholderia podalyriae TaxID=1938811 RepID=A0ABR7PTC3_9BURK|nr:hypothetical protein [Paraburkholderia podalyriae]
MNNDPGNSGGERRIWGGRKVVQCVKYMANARRRGERLADNCLTRTLQGQKFQADTFAGNSPAMNGQRVGYVRVSTFEPNAARQLDGLRWIAPSPTRRPARTRSGRGSTRCSRSCVLATP